MSKHTPGPWKRDTRYAAYKITVEIDGRRATVAECGFTYLPDIEANARLIAAAPDLLEALKRSLDWLSSYPGEGALGAYEQARAAIAKAEAQ